MKAVVIGGSGFLGSHVADALIKKGFKVLVFDKKKSLWIKKNQKMLIGDIKNIPQLDRAIKGSDVVYNFAAVADIGEALDNPIKSAKVNIIGNINILELCKKYKVKRFIFASSIYVYSQQGGFYRSSKQAAELYVEEYSRQYNLNYTILRFGSIYGPRSDIRNGLSRIIYDALKIGRVKYRGSARAVRQFIHVKDAANACIDILKKKFRNQNILLTGKKLSKIKDIMLIIDKILGIGKKFKFDNKTQKGHYNISPYSYQPKPAKKYYTKSTVDLQRGLEELIINLKKKNK